MQAVSLTTQAGCQVHTLMWENLVCTALCREVQVIDMFVNKSLEEIVDCKRILIKNIVYYLNWFTSSMTIKSKRKNTYSNSPYRLVSENRVKNSKAFQRLFF